MLIKLDFFTGVLHSNIKIPQEYVRDFNIIVLKTPI
jgi:hypothetical protein